MRSTNRVWLTNQGLTQNYVPLSKKKVKKNYVLVDGFDPDVVMSSDLERTFHVRIALVEI